jgi:DNA-binding transcriptional LysR family regulator
MELSQLRFFQELAKREHLTKTAEYLNITPPSLSVSISKLEHELGVKLFERSGRNIRLNENGKFFLEYVDQALETLEVGRNALAANVQTDRNSIMLGVSAQTLWLNGIQSFLSRYPQVSISRKSLTLSQLDDRAYMAQFDFVLTGVNDFPSKEWEHCVLVPDDTPRAGAQ